MDWKEENNMLVNTFTFGDFSEAFGFMTRVAMLVDRLDHHPEWSNVYNKVEIKLCTHDEGNTITDKDRHLAAEIDKIVKS
ncbi:MAG TPA: 4a-hydroxytetrahydrobiopterin dehydratase [Flavobacteriaceae bacterium]|nr:4a-hydroxytetrahydrobiopterin dehydratase [Flavobacteriaceae bacterium]